MEQREKLEEGEKKIKHMRGLLGSHIKERKKECF